MLVLAAAQQRDRFPSRAAAEGVDRLGPDLLPVPFHVPVPGQALVLEGHEQFAGGGDVAVPFVDPVSTKS